MVTATQKPLVAALPGADDSSAQRSIPEAGCVLHARPVNETKTSTARRGNQALAVVVMVALLAAVAGFVAGRTLTSPSDASGSLGPPDPSLVTARVELRELANEVVVRADLLFEESLEVRATPSNGSDADTAVVITRLSAVEGGTVAEGDLILEVAGRPVFAFRGTFPMYRTLTRGAVGEDVRQVQAALNRLGFITDVDGVYGESTERALAAFYGAAGYDPAGPTPETLAALAQAEQALAAAELRVAEAEAALELARSGPLSSSVLSAEAAVSQADAALAAAERSREDELSRLENEAAGLTQELADAEGRAAAARERLTAAQQGAHPDTGELPSDEELAELAAAVSASEADVDAATAAVETHERESADVLAEQDAAVGGASDQVAVAAARLTELIAPSDTSFQETAVAAARTDVANAEDALTDTTVAVGLPRAEIQFLETLPVQIDEVLVNRGGVLDGPIMTVSAGALFLESSVTPTQAELIEVGDRAVLDDPALTGPIDAIVTFIADSPGGEVEEGRFQIRVVPNRSVDPRLAGLNLRVRIPVEATNGPAMVVPVAALSSEDDRSVYVEVEEPSGPGGTRRVAVVLGLESAGLVEIEPIQAGDLAVGDKVVVGQR